LQTAQQNAKPAEVMFSEQLPLCPLLALRAGRPTSGSDLPFVLLPLDSLAQQGTQARYSR